MSRSRHVSSELIKRVAEQTRLKSNRILDSTSELIHLIGVLFQMQRQDKIKKAWFDTLTYHSLVSMVTVKTAAKLI